MGHGKAAGKGKGNAGRKPRGGRGGTHPWINSQIIQASEAKDVHHLMSVIMQHLPQMNLVNLSTAIHRVAKIAGADSWQQGQLRQNSNLDTLLNSVCTALNVVEATEVQPQSVSNVVWSLATLRIVHRPLLQVISLVCVSNMAQFKSFELSTTLWALAKLGSLEDAAPVDKAVFYAAATHINNNVNEFGFRCLATTAWAFATARQRHARLFRGMAAAMLPAAAGANCQEMANTAWAFGTADFHDDALFHELAEQALHRLEEFKPQEISNMLWGFATNSFFHEAFYARACVVAQKMDLQSQHLANILWAFARVRPRHPLTQRTVLALLPLCTQQLQTFKPQEVSSTLLATAKAVGNAADEMVSVPTASLENVHQEVLDFFHACLPWVVARLREFSEQSLANSVSAYAMVPVRGSDTLVDCAGQEVLKRMQDLDVNALVHLLKGFMLVPTTTNSVQIVKALAEGIAEQLDRVRAQEMQSLGRLLSRGANQQRDLDREEIRTRLAALAIGSGSSASPPSMPQQKEMFPHPVLQQTVASPALQMTQMTPQVLQQSMPSAGLPMTQMTPQVQMAVSMPPVQPGMIFPHAVAQAIFQQGLLTSVAQTPGALPQAPPLPAEVASRMNFPQAQLLENAQQEIFPEARRQQLSQIRAGGRSKNMPEAQQHPLCPISESSMMAALSDMNKNQCGQQPRASDAQHAGFRMDSATGPGVSIPLLPDQAYAHQPMMGMGHRPMQSPLPGGYEDPMMLMPATSLGASAEETVGERSLQIVAVNDHSSSRRGRNNLENTRRMLVKNSFLHVEDSDDDEDDLNCDGNSSHRSSSMPSNFSRDYEERARRSMPPADMLELLYSLRDKRVTEEGTAPTPEGAQANPGVSPTGG
mmetsp:Transcript_45903/g.107237  ORF Transcript_45903/g.107237 Transcript_45903/m.107237 type:complete len:875 (+) Transcript_45903:89-2713(+)